MRVWNNMYLNKGYVRKKFVKDGIYKIWYLMNWGEGIVEEDDNRYLNRMIG